MSSRWPTSIQMRRALRRWMRGFFYNIVSIWYMVSHHHTISSKILYGRKNYNTIEKKILYGKNFFTITIRNNNCKNFLPYYHTIFIAAIFCRPLETRVKSDECALRDDPRLAEIGMLSKITPKTILE